MLKKSFSIIILLCFLSNKLNCIKYNYDLAVCGIFQDEGLYLKEWIEFHKLMGVKYFYLYNNFSKDDYKEVLEPYLKNQEVVLIDWPIHAYPNDASWVITAYNHALRQAKKDKVKWLALLDLDEFLFPVQKNNLIEFLADYEDVGGVCVNWVMFGTSGVKKIAKDQLIIENLIMKAPNEFDENLHVKSIVRVDNANRIFTQHCAIYKPGYFQVTENKERFNGPWSPYVSINKIRINHYWSRDEEFFNEKKIQRRIKDVGEGAEKSIARNNKINQIIDKEIFKFIPDLKKQMGLNN